MRARSASSSWRATTAGGWPSIACTTGRTGSPPRARRSASTPASSSPPCRRIRARCTTTASPPARNGCDRWWRCARPSAASGRSSFRRSRTSAACSRSPPPVKRQRPGPGAARSRRSSRACCAGPRESRSSFPGTTDGTRRDESGAMSGAPRPSMPVPGELVRLEPRIRRLTQDNPSMFTAVGTNTHLIGERSVFILDPGPESDLHFDRIVAAVGSATVAAVIPTHHHPDHWPLAPRLAAHFGAPTLGFSAYGDYVPQRTVADGEVLDSGEVRMRAIHTPGHAPDHLCYLLDDTGRPGGGGTLMSGDHVMGWSTSVIAPPGGNLNDFMASLRKLAALDLRVMHPAHGWSIDDPQARIEELRSHREQRTTQALEALAAGLVTIPAMVERIYADVDRRLHPAAAR